MLRDDVAFLVAAGQYAASADNSQPWRFIRDGADLRLVYDAERVANRTFGPDDPATLLAMGGVIENLLQAADFLGIALRTDLEPHDFEGGRCYLRISLPGEGGISSSADAKTMPLRDRHTNRFSFKRQPIPAGVLSRVVDETEGAARVVVLDDRHIVRRMAVLVRRASEIRFQTREVHEWLGESLRFGTQEVASGDGLDVATLDLPPGGSLFLKFIRDWRRMAFLNRFGVYRLLSLVDSAPVGKAPALIAVISPEEDKDILSAGRLMTRVWTTLNGDGVAVHLSLIHI